MFDIHKFIMDYNISISPTSSKHYRHGWVNIACPFCYGNEGFHLGYNEDEGYWNCHRCSYKSMPMVIKKVCNVSFNEALSIIRKYGGRPSKFKQNEEDFITNTTIDVPFMKYLPDRISDSKIRKVREYLEKRKFNFVQLHNEWDIYPSHPLGDYKDRIIAPIKYQEKIVSYQGRAITNIEPRYKACPKKEEIIHHKDLLYGYDEAKMVGNQIVVCEGITDVWRLGYGAVCTFGIEISLAQVRKMTEFNRIIVLLDNDPQAKKKAEFLTSTLLNLGKDCSMIQLTDCSKSYDPADLSQKEADSLMEMLGFDR
jgi:DNA primase